MSDSAFLRIMTALLKHQVKKMIGDEALGAIGEEIVAIGGENLDEKIKMLLSEKTTIEALESAAKHANDSFLEKIDDTDIKQWMISLPLTNLPRITQSISNLSTSPDEKELEEAIRETIKISWKNLSSSQIDLAVNTFMNCIREALLPLEKQTLLIVGRAVLRTEDKINLLLKLTEKLIEQSSKPSAINTINLDEQFSKPDTRQERLYSNLLKIESYAKRIYVAPTRARGRNEVFRNLLKLSGRANSEFILKNKTIISFHDLHSYPWTEVCDSSLAIEYSSAEWALSEKTDKKNEFIDLLNKSLEATLTPEVLFDREEKYYYFAPTEDLRDKELSYPSLQKNTSRFVFKAYTKKTEQKIGYYRHSAFYGKFLRLDDNWYLEISPHYRFTKNGYWLSRFSDTQLSTIKRVELNPAVLGQIVMWSEYLCRRPDMFTKEYPFLSFSDLESFEVDFGFDDDAWLKREDEDNLMLDVVKSSVNDLPLFKGME